MLLACPKPAAIPTIAGLDCEVKFDQIVRIAFQRRDQASFANLAALQAVATWTPLLAAAADTKIQFSPLLNSMVIPSSEEQVQGGNDNTTVNGIEEYLGEGFVKVTGRFQGLTAAIAQSLRGYTVESVASAGITDLVAYFFDRNGRIIHNNLKGFDIYNFRIGSVGSEGFNAKNNYPFSFALAPEWDAAATITGTLDFNPLTIANS
jgi:hypothetical protein